MTLVGERRRLALVGRRALLVVCLAALAGCGIRMQTGVGGLRTYVMNHAQNVLCHAAGDLNPLTGVLAGSPDDPERVWLVGRDGRRISIAWPEGFSVEFAPDTVLRNERGAIAARQGDTVVLHHVHDYPGDGSLENPYLASRAFGGCYPASR
jgi:hypothetical protein